MKTKTLVYNALLIAIVVIMSVVPNIGFIQIGIFAITLLHIPVIIAGVLFGYKSALLIGTVFGVSSMIVAATRGAAGDLLFINPIVSVIPRIIFAFAVVLIYNTVKTFVKYEVISSGITAFISSLTHSVLVISAMYVSISMGNADAYLEAIQGGYLNFVIPLLGLQVVGEAALATIVTIPVVAALRKVID